MKKQKKSILVMAVMVAFVATGLSLPGLIGAGDLDPGVGPDDPGSAMFTLEDIYNRLNDNTTATKRTGGFTEPSAAPGSTGYTLDQIYELALPTRVEKTGQTGCWDSSGTSETCAGTGQDGELQKGVSWPVPRFTDNADGTVTDNLTGLIWLKNANCPTSTNTWSAALTFANSLYDGWTGDGSGGDCGLTDGSSPGDWRLPNVKELSSLAHFGYDLLAVPNAAGTGQWTEGDPFSGLQSNNYWSSTTFVGDTYVAWYVSMNSGTVSNDGKTAIPSTTIASPSIIQGIGKCQGGAPGVC